MDEAMAILARYGAVGGLSLLCILWLRSRILQGRIRLDVESVTVKDLTIIIKDLRSQLISEKAKREKAEVLAEAYLRHLEEEHDATRRTPRDPVPTD